MTDLSDNKIECHRLPSLSEADARAIGELIAATWPKPGKNAAFRAEQLLMLGRDYSGPVDLAPRVFVLRDAAEKRVIAAAVLEPRTLGTIAGDLTILGLAKVCSHPDYRGEGLGAKIVKAAFADIDAGVVPFSLFQTSQAVKPFYQRLGACTVENKIHNSLGDDPSANPFWDEVVMRYPATGDWPEGPIDLQGAGY